MENRNKILVIVCVIFGVLLVGLGSYVVYDKFIAKNNVEEKENNNDGKKNTELNLYEICSKAEQKSTCTRNLTLDNKNIEVTAVANERQDGNGLFEFTTLKVDGKIIYSDEMNISYVKAFEDLIILEIYCIYCGGESAGIPTVVIIDKSGNVVYDLYKINFEKGYEYDYKNKNFYEIKNNKIIVTASGVGTFSDYGPYPSFNCYFYASGEGTYINGDNYSQFSSKVAKIEYEVEYLGNNKFSNVKKVKEIKFGELYTKELCIQEFEEYERITKELEENE